MSPLRARVKEALESRRRVVRWSCSVDSVGMRDLSGS